MAYQADTLALKNQEITAVELNPENWLICECLYLS